ncbi:MAG: uroporphyrinogen decarboxylase family protein [Phycisphaerae bacterium]
MTSRERMLIALSNGRPDRLPCQVHGWMRYYLKTYLGGMDEWAAFEKFDLDFAIYRSPNYTYDERDKAKWRCEKNNLGKNKDGDSAWEETIHTPKGTLHHTGAYNDITSWTIEHLVKTPDDFELWNEFYPVPVQVDFSEIQKAKDRLGDRGIIRSHPFSPGQGSPWQSFCTLVDTQNAIMFGMDTPDFLHHALDAICQKTERVTDMWKGTPADMVEVGGGAGSNTVISPNFFKEFCLPYDLRQNKLLHEAKLKVVYHLCGGLMHMLEHVVATHADGLETMTPPAMGGDCNLREASRRVGGKLFFIGGFDQNAGIECGTPARARELVFECFEATKDHAGYICCPSDHFFRGDPANVQAFANACKECRY